jgi:uncharacterized protein YggE
METESKISVQGKGAIHVVPDVTRLEVRIDSVFITHEEAYAKARENSQWIVKILEYNKKPGALAKTICLDISDYTEHEYKSGKYIGEKKVGFALDQRIKIDLPIDNKLVNCIVRGVGKFIPDAQVSIGYTLQDPRPSQLKMLGRAVTDAKEKAEIMAKAAGCQLGAVASITYDDQDIHTYSQARNIHSNKEAMASTESSLDITPDDLVISDTVNVEWYLVNTKAE